MGSWFIAPVLAWGMALLLLPIYRGYTEAMLLLYLISIPSRWVFLLSSLSILGGLLFRFSSFRIRHFVSYLIVTILLFLAVYSISFVSWFKLISLSGTDDPPQVLSNELLPSWNWESFSLMFFGEPILNVIASGEVKSILVFLFYIFLKFFLFYFLASLLWKYYGEASNRYDQFLQPFCLSVFITIAGITCMPFYEIDFIDKYWRIFIITYELTYLILYVPIGVLYFSLLRSIRI